MVKKRTAIGASTTTATTPADAPKEEKDLPTQLREAHELIAQLRRVIGEREARINELFDENEDLKKKKKKK